MSHNHGRHICAALDSIASQDYSQIELIVVDDASDDNSVEAISDWLRSSVVPAQFIARREHGGLARSLNMGMRMARGEFVSVLTAADRYLPHKISSHVAKLKERSKAVFVYGDATVVDAFGKTTLHSYTNRYGRGSSFSGEVLNDLLQLDFIPAPTVSMRGSALDVVGDFFEGIVNPNYDMWLRLASQGELLYSGTLDAVLQELPKTKMVRSDYLRRLQLFGKLRKVRGADREALDEMAVSAARDVAYLTSPTRGLSYATIMMGSAALYAGPRMAVQLGATTMSSALRNKSTRVVAKVEPMHDGPTIAGGELLSSVNAVCTTVQADDHPREPIDGRTIRLDWHHFRDAVIDTSSSFVSIEKRVFIQDPLFQLIANGGDFSSSFCRHTGETAVVSRNPEEESIERGIAIVGLGALNWYHWLVEVLPRAVMAQRLPADFDGWPLLVPADVARSPQHRQTLEKCRGERPIRFVDDTPVRVRDLVWIDAPSVLPFNLAWGWPSPMSCYHHPEAIGDVVDALTSGLILDTHHLPRRFMLIRSGNQLRRYNQADIVAMAKGLGFATVDTAELSFEEQVALFRGAEVVIGPSGAAWTNILFSRPGVRGLIWLPEQFRGFNVFANLAAQAGCELQHHLYPSDATECAHCHLDGYHLDPSTVERELVKILRQIE